MKESEGQKECRNAVRREWNGWQGMEQKEEENPWGDEGKNEGEGNAAR